jgi:outer membrane protein assembly factor BamB
MRRLVSARAGCIDTPAAHPYLPRMTGKSPLAVLAALTLSFAAAQADWLHYRGPAQNGVSPEKGWSAQLPAGGPRVLWKASLGKGTSSVTTSGDRAFTMGFADGKDVVYCLDAKSGKALWRFDYPSELAPQMFEGGPRSTPTLDGSRVYVLGQEGQLFCLDAASGRKVWEKHFVKDFGGRRPEWGFSGSPLVSGNLLLCDVGASSGSTVALDKTSGKVVWKNGGDMPGYASPVVATLGGKATVIVFKADHLVGHDLKDGSELWRAPWKTDYDVNAATPLVLEGDRIFISSGYNAGCALIQVSGGKATELWRNKKLRAHVNTPVPVGGHLYGIDGNTGGGNLVCLDVASGEQKWVEKSVKGGALIAADGKLIVLTERGELVIAEASPAGFKALSRAPVLKKRCWAQPTLDAGRLYLRDNEGEIVCLDLSGR